MASKRSSKPKVRDWPSYLLRDIPDGLRKQISVDAKEQNVSVADAVRAVLCDHYDLSCPPVNQRGYEAKFQRKTSTLLLRVSPELFQVLAQDSQMRPMKETILRILNDRYAAVT